MRIYVLVLEGVFDTGLTAVLDSLSMANNLSQASGIATAGFDITIAGVRQEVHTALGMKVPVCDIANSPTPDWVILPALNYTNAEALLPVLEREDVVDALAVLRKGTKRERGLRQPVRAHSCLLRVGCSMALLRQPPGGSHQCFVSVTQT